METMMMGWALGVGRWGRFRGFFLVYMQEEGKRQESREGREAKGERRDAMGGGDWAELHGD
jgi:hypothetical protein